jgi:hypothetical protein
MRKSLPLLLIVVLAAAAAGCGGGGGGGGGGKASGGGGKIPDPTLLSACLNNNDWIVSPTGEEVSGNAASGAGVDIHIFQTKDEAAKFAAKKPKKSTAVVDTSVISFLGTVTPLGPAPPAPVNQKDLTSIKTCIAQSG